MKTIDSISLFGTLPPIKGISEYCIEQANCLSKKFKVEFNSFSEIYPEFLYPGGTKEYSKVFSIKENANLKIKRNLFWYNPFSWIYVGLTNQGDLVHINWWIYILFPVFFTIAILSKIRRKKVILTLHNVTAHESNFLDRFFSLIMYRVADILLVHTEGNKETLIRKFKMDKNKIHLIPYGPLNFYKTKNILQSEAKKYLGLEEKNKVILFFGTIRKYKGLDILIKAFAQVTKTVSEARLIIAGKNWVSWSPYQDLIIKLNLLDKVILHIKYIRTDEVQYYFTAADVVILPYTCSDFQSGVAKIAEAFGKPVIASFKQLPQLIENFFTSSRIIIGKKNSWDSYLEKYLELVGTISNHK